jgi:siroheme synthase-like protein
MSYFPMFVDLEGKKVVVVGGGKIAKDKCDNLREYGAEIVVVAPKIIPELEKEEGIVCRRRSFMPEDLNGAYAVIAATNESAVNETVSRLCKERKIPVNVVDQMEQCDFIFGSLVKRGKLSIGVCTGGASPHCAAQLKCEIADGLPDSLEEILDFLYDIRPIVRKRVENEEDRKVIFHMAADYCLSTGEIPDEETFEELLQRVG